MFFCGGLDEQGNRKSWFLLFHGYSIQNVSMGKTKTCLHGGDGEYEYT